MKHTRSNSGLMSFIKTVRSRALSCDDVTKRKAESGVAILEALDVSNISNRQFISIVLRTAAEVLLPRLDKEVATSLDKMTDWQLEDALNKHKEFRSLTWCRDLMKGSDRLPDDVVAASIGSHLALISFSIVGVGDIGRVCRELFKRLSAAAEVQRDIVLI